MAVASERLDDDPVWPTAVILSFLERRIVASIQRTLVELRAISLLAHHKFHVKDSLASGSIVLHSREELGRHPQDVT